MSDAHPHTVRQSPLLDLEGAVEADPPDAGVAAHYGSIAAEQRRLVAGEGFVDLSHRDVISISGPDRLTWLHALTTQHVLHLAPGERTTLRFPLQMHPGMDGDHLFRIQVPVEGAADPLVVSVAGDFR